MYALSEVYRRRGTLNPGQGKELPHIMSHLFQVSRIKPHVLNWIQVYLQHFNFYTVKPRFTGSPMNESCDMMWYRQTGTMKLHALVLFFVLSWMRLFLVSRKVSTRDSFDDEFLLKISSTLGAVNSNFIDSSWFYWIAICNSYVHVDIIPINSSDLGVAT